MSVHIELIYGKKLGLPAYSSHHFDISLKTEVASIEDVHGEVDRVYRILQSSVDEQIVNPGFMPGENGESKGNGTNGKWGCSEKQKELILKLVGENNLDRNDIEQLAIDRFGRGVTLLNKLEASGIIDELFQRTGQSNGRNGKHGRSYAQGRAA